MRWVEVTEVKVLLTSVALALAVYQLVLIAVGYGKLRPPFLAAEPAAKAHRASGDTIAVLLIVVVAILVVNAKFPASSAAEREAREERQEQRIDAQEERREQQEEQREEP